MLNFTVGPVMFGETVRGIGAEQVPYFRTPEFSEIMLENERLVKLFIKAEKDARVVFITGSGTSSMEATVMDVLSPDDKVLVIDGGSFASLQISCKVFSISSPPALFRANLSVCFYRLIAYYPVFGLTCQTTN